ncbi:MAG: hypothetical protein JXA89_23930 [Anaerolineae bacterium]|nr:hypothetical protein [Anaerolineae bacterium]
MACSNDQVWRLSEALWISETKNLACFECYQPQYGLVVRNIEQELVPLCLHKARLNEVSHLPDRYPESFEKNVGERRIQALGIPSL